MGESRQAERLQQLFELARTARGWTRAQLADALGRDPSRIVPASGNPKLDIVVKLARVLEWPVGDVVEALYDVNSDDMDLLIGHTVDRGIEKQMEGKSADELYELALELHGRGAFEELLIASSKIRSTATEPSQRAESFAFEAVAWLGLGRYANALEACNAGLAIRDLPEWLKRNFQVNLAYCLYLLWRLQLSLGLSDLLVRHLSAVKTPSKADLGQLSLAHYVRGNVHRRMIVTEQDQADYHIKAAKADFDVVAAIAAEHSGKWKGSPLDIRKMGANFAIQEVLVESGEIPAQQAVDHLLEHLDEYAEISDSQPHDELEAIGWGCIFGCNIAIRHLQGDQKQRAFSIFSNKALEIADAINNWAFRERVFSLQYAIYDEIQRTTGFSVPVVLDDEERSAIVSVMGRFPHFRSTGWRMLEPAHIDRRW